MSASLYNTDILRLAASIPHHQRLADPHASAEKRTAVCGSRVIADVKVDGEGRLAAMGLEVRACALGQASASLLAAHALGKPVDELITARERLIAYLSAGEGDLEFWPGLSVLSPAQAYPARHASIILPFETLAEAITKAAR